VRGRDNPDPPRGARSDRADCARAALPAITRGELPREPVREVTSARSRLRVHKKCQLGIDPHAAATNSKFSDGRGRENRDRGPNDGRVRAAAIAVSIAMKVALSIMVRGTPARAGIKRAGPVMPLIAVPTGYQ
jgi:hypothetical protein